MQMNKNPKILVRADASFQKFISRDYSLWSSNLFQDFMRMEVEYRKKLEWMF